MQQVDFDAKKDVNASSQNSPRFRRAALLLAKSSMTGAAIAEMELLVKRASEITGGAEDRAIDTVKFAFSEQGVPNLRDVFFGLIDESFQEIIIVPWVLPMEPGFNVWITRTLRRWQAAEPERLWPSVRIASAPGTAKAIDPLLAELIAAGVDAPVSVNSEKTAPEGSVVPPQLRRVLMCQGAPCNNAGAAVVWGHLRNEQKRLNLRTTGDGVMTAKATCLGPCNLAPVLQVFPEGTYYGGVNEAGIDKIIAEHLLGGRVVTELAYAPLPGKQYLRKPLPDQNA